GTLTISNSTISGNETFDGQFSSGGGIFNNGTTSLSNVTVAFNKAENIGTSGGGGGIANASGKLTMANSIVAGNRAPSGQGPECSGVITSARDNLIGGGLGKVQDCSFTPTTGDHISGFAQLALDTILDDNGIPGSTSVPLTKTHGLVAFS